jgi:hypothetical protein
LHWRYDVDGIEPNINAQIIQSHLIALSISSVLTNFGGTVPDQKEKVHPFKKRIISNIAAA